VPSDPFTDGPFRYRRDSNSFTLYSPGPTNIDHGGSYGPWNTVKAGGADFCLDIDDFECDYTCLPGTPMDDE
jgi:hypothetical protein